MFYVNTDTKLFIAAPQSDSCRPYNACVCGDQQDKPLFLSTRQNTSSCRKVSRPVIYNYATNVLQFTFLDNEGLPYDLTDCTLALAVDNTFSHSDSLIALADGDVLSPLDGIVEFKVNKFSKKFTQLLKSGIPDSSVWMQVTAYNKSGDQIVLLQDRGIKLSTKLLLNQGLTQDNLLNFYNKQQVDAFLMDLGRYQLIPGKVIITQSSNSSLKSGSLFIDHFNHDFYLEVSNSLVYLGNLDKSDYYTKAEVEQIAAALSDSIEGLRQTLDNYYNKSYIDELEGRLSNSIASVKSSLSNYYTIQQADQLLDTKASNSYVQQINQQVQDLKQLHIVKLDTPQQGYAATYQLQDHNNNALGASINIIKDKFLSDVKLIVASQQDHEADPSVIIGDPYLKFTFNTQPVSTVYVAVKSLVDVYSAGQGIKLQNNTFSVESDQQADSIKFLQIGQNTIGLKGITSAVDKVLSDAKNYADTKLQSYYDKEQVNSFIGQLSNSIAAVKGTFSNYYTKSQIDQTVSSISNSIQGIKDSFGGYYTKDQVDAIVAGLSNSIDLSNYYTKSEVDDLFSQFSDSVDLSNYYTKGEVDNIASSLSNSIASVKSSLSNYYTKTEVNSIAETLSDSIEGIRQSLQGYYNKDEVDAFVQGLSNSIAAVKGTFGSYYTKSQIDQIAAALSDSIEAVKSSLNNYYDKGQIDSIADALSNSIAAVKSSLSNYYTSAQIDSTFSQYYTKSQVEGFLGSLSDSLAAVKDTFSQYYNKGEVDAFVSALSDSIEALDNKLTQQKNYNNLTNKPAIEGVTLQGNVSLSDFGLPQFVGSYMQFSAVDADNQYTLNGTTTIPVAVFTGANHIYLIQKGSLIYDTVNQSLIFDATPYMAYDDMQTFTGTWRLYFAAGNSPKDGDLILPKTSTSIVPQHGLIIRHTLQANDTILISTSQLTSDRQVTFQLHLIQPSTAVSFTLPGTLMWGNTAGDFNSSNPAPSMSIANTLYCIVIRWDGSDLLANLAYTKEMN